MLPRGGRATDDTTRGVEAEGAARGELEADDSTRVGGRTTRGKRAADDRTTHQEGGAHDVVGGGNGDDHMRGNLGDDTIYGFEGNDVAAGDEGQADIGVAGDKAVKTEAILRAPGEKSPVEIGCKQHARSPCASVERADR